MVRIHPGPTSGSRSTERFSRLRGEVETAENRRGAMFGATRALKEEVAPMRYAVLAVAIVGVLALLWIGGESHYRSCVDAAQVRTLNLAINVSRVNGPVQDSAAKRIYPARVKAVDGCSRLPF